MTITDIQIVDGVVYVSIQAVSKEDNLYCYSYTCPKIQMRVYIHIRISNLQRNTTESLLASLINSNVASFVNNTVGATEVHLTAEREFSIFAHSLNRGFFILTAFVHSKM